MLKCILSTRKSEISLYQVHLFRLGIFHPELGQNILFGIGNWAEIRTQIRVMESPELYGTYMFALPQVTCWSCGS